MLSGRGGAVKRPDLSDVPGQAGRRPDIRHKIICTPHDVHSGASHRERGPYLIAGLIGRETGQDEAGNPTYEAQPFSIVPPGRYKIRYMKCRIDDIESERERKIMIYLQEYGKSVADVAAELGVSDKRIYKVRDQHTWSPKERPDLYGPSGYPWSPYDATRGFEPVL